MRRPCYGEASEIAAKKAAAKKDGDTTAGRYRAWMITTVCIVYLLLNDQARRINLNDRSNRKWLSSEHMHSTIDSPVVEQKARFSLQPYHDRRI